MARPFGQSENSEKQPDKENETQNKISGKESNLPSRSEDKRSENLPQCSSRNQTSDLNAAGVTNVYCISNSTHVNCGPTFFSVVNNVCDNLSSSNMGRDETDRKIKIRKGVLTSNRNITFEDIHIVSKDVQEDWKELLKKLPGITTNNLHFHQTFVNAMDRKDSTNMAEIALCTWKTELPEFSTIGNLSKTLFNIGHPDVVTRLRP